MTRPVEKSTQILMKASVYVGTSKCQVSTSCKRIIRTVDTLQFAYMYNVWHTACVLNWATVVCY